MKSWITCALTTLLLTFNTLKCEAKTSEKQTDNHLQVTKQITEITNRENYYSQSPENKDLFFIDKKTDAGKGMINVAKEKKKEDIKRVKMGFQNLPEIQMAQKYVEQFTTIPFYLGNARREEAEKEYFSLSLKPCGTNSHLKINTGNLNGFEKIFMGSEIRASLNKRNFMMPVTKELEYNCSEELGKIGHSIEFRASGLYAKLTNRDREKYRFPITDELIYTCSYKSGKMGHSAKIEKNNFYIKFDTKEENPISFGIIKNLDFRNFKTAYESIFHRK